MTEMTVGDRLDEIEGLSCIAALASPVTHEFNNFLNLVLLQVAVMQQQASGTFRDELAAIRRQGKSLAALIQQWQHHRQRYQGLVGPTDLNTVIERTAGRLRGQLPAGARLEVDLADGLPRVTGTDAEAALLVRFLVTNAAAALGGAEGAVTVRTQPDTDAVILSVEDPGPAPTQDQMQHLFDPQAPSRPGANGLEMSACETLARRRMQGRIEAAALPGGGLAVRVRFKPAG